VGNRRKRALRAQFDRKLRMEIHGARTASDAGLLAVREMDEAFRKTEAAAARLSEPRAGWNAQHTLLAWLRQVVQHAWYVVLRMADAAISRERFARILERIERFGVPRPLAESGEGRYLEAEHER